MANNKNKNQNANNPVNFFQFTKEQLFLNIEKYDCIKKSNPSTMFSTNTINTTKINQIYPKRLNSIDTSMLEDAAYTVLDNEELKLEKQIEDTEKILKELTEKLIVADTIKDDIKKRELIIQRKAIIEKRENLLEQYKTQNFETRLTSIYTQIKKIPANIKRTLKKKIKNYIKNSKFLKSFKPIMRAILVRDTINRLNKINKSVDELVNMKVPFGEQEEKYNALINHLSRATALHAQIRKEIKK